MIITGLVFSGIDEVWMTSWRPQLLTCKLEENEIKCYISQKYQYNS